MSIRKIVFWCHLSMGVVAGLVVFILSLTGVLLGYERQITAWVDRSAYVITAPQGTPPVSKELALSKLLQSGGVAPATLTWRADAQSAIEAGYGRDRTALLNPYTGELLGDAPKGARSFFQSVEAWHRWLAAPQSNRAPFRSVVDASNLIFLLIIVSGPFLWLPRKWTRKHFSPIVWFRRLPAGKARDWNWHNVIGIWCAAPLFLVVLSAVIMSYPWANGLLYTLTGTTPPAEGARGGPGPGRSASTPPVIEGLGALCLRAEQQVPDWRSISLRIPPSPRAPVVFTIDQGNGGQPNLRAQLTLDRATGEVVRWEPFSANNTGRRLRLLARFAHTGEAGGVIGQSIATIASLGACFLVWTGLALAWRRFRGWRSRDRTAVAAEESAAVASMRGR